MASRNLGRAEDTDAIDVAVTRERAVKPRQRTRRRMAVGGRNLRAAPCARIDDAWGERTRRIQERLSRRRVGILARVREDIHLPGRWRLRRDHLAAAHVVALVESDMAIDPERCGDLVVEIRADALAGDTANYLSDEPSVSQCMIAMLRPRLPERLLGGERRDHRIPVEDRLARERLANSRQTRAMVQQLPHRYPVLAMLREFRPVTRDRRVKIEQTLVGQAMSAYRGHPLGGREDGDDRVARPWARARLVGVTAPQVDDHLAIDAYGNGGAVLVALVEIFGERSFHAREARIAVSFNLGHKECLSCLVR